MTPLSLVPEQARQKGIELWRTGRADHRRSARRQGERDDVSAAHVRRGSSGRARPRKAARRVSVPQEDRRQAAGPAGPGQSRWPRWTFGLFVAGDRSASLWSRSMSRPRSALAAGEAVGDAGFRVKQRRHPGHPADGPQARSTRSRSTRRRTGNAAGRRRGDPRAAAASTAGSRTRACRAGFPDTLVIDIVERKPAALWQDEERLSLIDSEGVVLDRVPVSADARPAAADRHGRQCPEPRRSSALLDKAPTLKAAAGVGDLGRPAPLGPAASSRARPSRLPEGDSRLPERRSPSSPRWTSRPACSAAASSASTCAFPAR